MLGLTGGGGKDKHVDETSESEAAANARASLEGAAADAPGKAKGGIDMAAAYRELEAWTMTRMDKAGDALTVKANQKLEVDFAKKGTGDKGAFWRKNWFKAYWHYQCKKFAIALTEHIPGKQFGNLKTLISQTQDASNKKGDVATEIVGRTEMYRGMTIGEVAAAEKSSPQLKPGMVLQVKLHYKIDHPYMPAKDFQHWVTYVGNGRFSDTMVGHDSPGADYDPRLASWVKTDFAVASRNPKNGALRYDKDPEFAVAGAKTPKPVPGLLPRVSAVYDPSVADSKKVSSKG